ncbi:MMPL family transporter [Streptomyces cellulosae]|uniref:MMPL family transporter n=1 Tax=Streptomyces cellulosae TaxID=1968 RepID=UPI000B06E718|nr:MMPL family transporter [Streptomyces cellulosae]
MTARQNKAAVEDSLGSLDGGDQVASTTDPYETGAVSEDGTIAYSTITYTADAVDLTEPTKSALENPASQSREAGLTVEIGGSALDAEEEPGGTTELIGVAVAAVVLVDRPRVAGRGRIVAADRHRGRGRRLRLRRHAIARSNGARAAPCGANAAPPIHIGYA